MPKLLRDLAFLAINTILLAVIAFNTVNTLRVVQAEIDNHRLRNESENLCQIQVVFDRTQRGSAPVDWVKEYLDCVDRRSGVKSPPIQRTSN